MRPPDFMRYQTFPVCGVVARLDSQGSPQMVFATKNWLTNYNGAPAPK
jgi:hypothetical protein